MGFRKDKFLFPFYWAMAEWFKAVVSEAIVGLYPPQVRILLTQQTTSYQRKSAKWEFSTSERFSQMGQMGTLDKEIRGREREDTDNLYHNT